MQTMQAYLVLLPVSVTCELLVLSCSDINESEAFAISEEDKVMTVIISAAAFMINLLSLLFVLGCYLFCLSLDHKRNCQYYHLPSAGWHLFLNNIGLCDSQTCSLCFDISI